MDHWSTLVHEQSFHFDVNGRFDPTWCVTLYFMTGTCFAPNIFAIKSQVYASHSEQRWRAPVGIFLLHWQQDQCYIIFSNRYILDTAGYSEKIDLARVLPCHSGNKSRAAGSDKDQSKSDLTAKKTTNLQTSQRACPVLRWVLKQPCCNKTGLR